MQDKTTVYLVRPTLRIDFELLDQQRNELIELIRERGDCDLMGIVDLVDSIKGQAVKYGIPESEVFPKEAL